MQSKFAWAVIALSAVSFVLAVWAAAVGNPGGFLFGFAFGLAFAAAGIYLRRGRLRGGVHAGAGAGRGLLVDERDLIEPATPPPERWPDPEDRTRP